MIALDANILVYAVQSGDHLERDRKARELLSRLGSIQPTVPLQVLGEVLNVYRNKKLTSHAHARARVEEFLEPFIVRRHGQMICSLRLRSLSCILCNSSTP